MRRRHTTSLAIAAAIAGAIGLTLYGLADRYLIEHVERVVSDPIPAASAAGSDTTAGTSSGTDRIGSLGQSGITGESGKSDGTDRGTASHENGAEASGAAYQADDWSYRSDDLNIEIKQVKTGSGSDQIIYYAADVKVADASMLKAAFADNAFGRNITEDTSKIASDHQAVFAINGDYYGFRGDGVVIRNGELFRDEPAREAFALFADGTMASFDETQVSADELLADGAIHSLSFGPALVRDGEAVQDFGSVKIDTNFGNRSIQNANPRTGIGMIEPNHYVFVVVDGRSDESRGMTLEQFAQLFADLGCTEAYNLDGGGSSTMYFMGRVA